MTLPTLAEKAKVHLVDFDFGLEDGVKNVLWTKGAKEHTYEITFNDGSVLKGKMWVL